MANFDINFILIQALAVLGFLGLTGAFYFKSRKAILGSQAMGLIFWALHYTLLGAWTGVTLSVLAAIRSMLFNFRKEGNLFDKNIILYIFLAVFAVATALSWEGFYSIFPMLALYSATISHWQKDPQKIRIYFLPTYVFWFTYDVFVLSIGGMITESVMLISTLYTIYLNRKK